MYKFGVDVGGTTVKMGLFDEQGTLLEKFEIPTDKTEDGSHIIEQITKRLNQAMEEHDLTVEECMGVGVGLPGPVDEQGNILGCVNLGWGVFPVEKAFSEQFHGLPVKAANDANVAALGEQTAGAAKGRRNVVMVTLGTGVGGGIIIDGKILTGANGGAGEIGHITVNPKEEARCNCGKHGCLEQYASATGVVRVVKNLKSFYPDTGLQEECSAKDIFDAAKAGDILAMKAVQELGEYLGLALSFVANIVNPQAIVIGGGVSRAGKILIDEVEQKFQKYVFRPCRNVEFLLAKLGNDAGIYGASALIS